MSFGQDSVGTLKRLKTSLEQQGAADQLVRAVGKAIRTATTIAAIVNRVARRKKSAVARVTTTESVLQSRAAILDLREATERALQDTGAAEADTQDDGLITDEGSGRGVASATSNVRLRGSEVPSHSRPFVA